MEIHIYQFIAGARKAKGLTVIIDVFRAFSVACYAMNNGVKTFIPVGDLDTAYKLKQENPDYILMGEREGIIQPGFDYGNSPSAIQSVDFTGKTVVHTTSAGTQGIVNAKHADEIITGSFVNAQAIIDYIRMKNPPVVSLVCMGWKAEEEADEDTLFAKYVKSVLEGTPMDFHQIYHYMKNESKTGKFLDVTDASAPPMDFELCLSLNRFPFVLKVEPYVNSFVQLRKIPVETRGVEKIDGIGQFETY